jgi:hypothetical protein
MFLLQVMKFKYLLNIKTVYNKKRFKFITQSILYFIVSIKILDLQ